jgi:hypothetical protein
VDLLRPLEWVSAQAVNSGGVVRLDMPEMGAVGWARVVAVELCPPLDDGPRQLVTAVFRHWRGRVVELTVEGEVEPLGITPGHPVWSADRQDWIPAGELEIGERLLAKDGNTPRVLCRAWCSEPEPVYNVEVEGDHCYRVGEQGLLVHNVSIDECQFLGLTFFMESGVANGIKYFDLEPVPDGSGQQRATKIQARLNKSHIDPGGTPASSSIIPAGWDATINPGRPEAVITRGHLLGDQLGGSGSERRNLVTICHQSTNVALMRDRFENPVRRLIGMGYIVDYEVVAVYGDTMHPGVPTTIRMRAGAFNCKTGDCQMMMESFPNPGDVKRCPDRNR